MNVDLYAFEKRNLPLHQRDMDGTTLTAMNESDLYQNSRSIITFTKL